MTLNISLLNKILGVMAWNVEAINPNVLLKEIGGAESADVFQVLLDSEIMPLLSGMDGDYCYSSDSVDPLCTFFSLLKKVERHDLHRRYAAAVVALCQSIFDGDWDIESDDFYDDVHHKFDNEDQVRNFVDLLEDCEKLLDAEI